MHMKFLASLYKYFILFNLFFGKKKKKGSKGSMFPWNYSKICYFVVIFQEF